MNLSLLVSSSYMAWYQRQHRYTPSSQCRQRRKVKKASSSQPTCCHSVCACNDTLLNLITEHSRHMRRQFHARGGNKKGFSFFLRRKRKKMTEVDCVHKLTKGYMRQLLLQRKWYSVCTLYSSSFSSPIVILGPLLLLLKIIYTHNQCVAKAKQKRTELNR